jgi:LPXTG-motif cell wall-anchored protein
MNEIAAVQEQLDFLPSEVTTPEEVEAIVAATKEYEALSEAQKAYIESDSLVLLQTAQEGAKTVNRTSNGVTVDGDFPWYIQFQVQLNNDKSDSSVLAGQNADTFISPYEMQLWDLMNECEYQLNGQQVRITMPAPDDQLYTQLVVIHYLKDGSIEYITPIYNADGTLSFVTTSFSPYDVAGLKLAGSQSLVGNTDKAYGNKNTTSSSGTTTKLTPNVSAGSTSGSVTKKNTQKSQTTQSQTGKKSSGTTLRRVNPKTGDMQQTAWYAGFAAAALAVLGIAGKKTRKKEI